MATVAEIRAAFSDPARLRILLSADKLISSILEDALRASVSGGIPLAQALVSTMETRASVWQIQTERDVRNGLVDASNEAYISNVSDTFDLAPETAEFTWQLETTIGLRHCPDCIPRAGVTMSLRDWQTVGVGGIPGIPNLAATTCVVYGYQCHCSLVAVKQAKAAGVKDPAEIPPQWRVRNDNGTSRQATASEIASWRLPEGLSAEARAAFEKILDAARAADVVEIQNVSKTIEWTRGDGMNVKVVISPSSTGIKVVGYQGDNATAYPLKGASFGNTGIKPETVKKINNAIEEVRKSIKIELTPDEIKQMNDLENRTTAPKWKRKEDRSDKW